MIACKSTEEDGERCFNFSRVEYTKRPYLARNECRLSGEWSANTPEGKVLRAEPECQGASAGKLFLMPPIRAGHDTNMIFTKDK